MSLAMTIITSFNPLLAPTSLRSFSRQFGPRPSPRRLRANMARCELRSSSSSDASFGHNNDGKLVDEDMIMLKMRIREMKFTSETSEDDTVPSDWMEWEKKYYVENYGSDICDVVGYLQSQLMRTRPGLALAILGLVALSVPFSMGVVLLHLADVANEVVVGFHV